MYTEQSGIHIVEVPVARFGLKLVDKKKKDCGENVANAGFFANFHEEGDFFTLPVGHLVCDYEAESKWVEHYCKQRGRFNGKKYVHDVTSYANQFRGKSVSTLVIQNGKASIQDLTELPECAYAIAGIPIMRNGNDVKFATYVQGQGWDGSPLYATMHTFVGLKDDPGKVYVIGMRTSTWNMIHTAEAFRKFKALGFRDVIKLDGGGSFYLNADGNTVSTSENRQINTIITFGATGSEDEGGNTMFKIALGAGHGIGTAGKRCHKSLDPNETREWWLNDRICDYTENGLRDYDGYELLRVDDSDDGKEDIALAARVNSANEWGADVYISVHHNAYGKVFTGSGIVALTHPKSSTAAVEWRNDLYEALIEHTGLRGNRANPKATSDLYVLRKTKMPAVLLELGFMDSTVDVPIILTDEYARECANAIVEVLVQRGKLTRKKVEEKTIYRVQVGAFSQKANAEKMVAELKAKGYQAYTVKA